MNMTGYFDKCYHSSNKVFSTKGILPVLFATY